MEPQGGDIPLAQGVSPGVHMEKRVSAVGTTDVRGLSPGARGMSPHPRLNNDAPLAQYLFELSSESILVI